MPLGARTLAAAWALPQEADLALAVLRQAWAGPARQAWAGPAHQAWAGQAWAGLAWAGLAWAAQAHLPAPAWARAALACQAWVGQGPLAWVVPACPEWADPAACPVWAGRAWAGLVECRAWVGPAGCRGWAGLVGRRSSRLPRPQWVAAEAASATPSPVSILSAASQRPHQERRRRVGPGRLAGCQATARCRPSRA